MQNRRALVLDLFLNGALVLDEYSQEVGAAAGQHGASAQEPQLCGFVRQGALQAQKCQKCCRAVCHQPCVR